jgi:hypothetical protein
MNQPTMPTQTQETAANEIDALKLQRFRQNAQENQNVSMGFFAGLLAALLGALVWAIITDLTHFQIGWMAVGVGFLVGFAVRRFGQGIDKSFGIMGALLALGGCVVGNFLSVCMMVAHSESMGVMEVLSELTPAACMSLMAATFSPIDLLFYGIAVYQGYHFSIRRMTPEEIAGLAKQS